jgi:hypothetical protein
MIFATDCSARSLVTSLSPVQMLDQSDRDDSEYRLPKPCSNQLDGSLTSTMRARVVITVPI